MKTVKKTLALLLALVLLISVTPMVAIATLWSGGGEGNCSSAKLDLTGFKRSELSDISVEYVVEHLTDNSGDPIEVDGSVVAYAKGEYYSSSGLDDFVLIGKDGKMDLSPTDSYDDYAYLMLVIGTPDQLDRDNKFIRVRVTYPARWIPFEASAWTEDNMELSIADYNYGYSTTSSGSTYDVYWVYIMPSESWKQGDPIRIRLQPEDDLLLAAVSGRFESLDMIPPVAPFINDLLEGEYGYKMDSSKYSEDVTFLRLNAEIDPEDMSWRQSVREVNPALVYVMEAQTSIYNWPSIYYQDEDGTWTDAVRSYSYDRTIYDYVTILNAGLTLDNTYYVSTSYEDYDGQTNNSLVTKAVVGTFETIESAESEFDVKALLFPGSGFGLPWNFSKGPLNITVFDVYGNVLHKTFNVAESSEDEAQNPLSSDTYFTVSGAYDPVYEVSCDTYVMSYQDDSYYPSGYQTLFVLNREGSASGEEGLKPYFWHADKANIFASIDGTSGELQESGENLLPVTYGKPIHYSASAEDGTNLRQYFVTFVTQTEGSALFVNAATNSDHIDDDTGLPMRTVILDATHKYRHDILFANFGNEEMTGLKVALTGANGIKLDDYWTIRPDSVGTLPPFDEGDPDNYGKIRIVPVDKDAFAKVSGKLTISADGVDPVTILLTGSVGKPKITTTVMKDGAVKYVPYSTLIQTNYIGDVTDAIAFSITKGELPDGVGLKPNGEVYGVPLETGTFTFTVKASLKDDPSVSDSRAYTLVVAENTDENVENATDAGYELIDRIPRVITPADYLFHSEGELGEFIAIYIDGRKLDVNAEYLLEEGSTKITVLEETFGDEGEGDHTIAAEFRIDGDEDGEMKRVAQNFTLEEGEDEPDEPEEPTVNPPKPPAVPEVPEYKPTPAPKPAPAPEPEPEKPVKVFGFVDVPQSAWFYDDVKWVFDRDLMLGVSENLFDPDGPVDAATIVMVLARTIGVDLTQYANSTEVNLPQDQWYSAAANWATQSGLIDDTFERNKPYSRGQMAVLLYKYFKYIGIDCSQPDPTVEFADADQMTPEQNEAYQVLYNYGIFKGVGNNRMDVYSNTSRAQLAALMHRLKLFITSKIG